MKIASWGKSLHKKLTSSLQRFPVTIACCVAVVIILIMMVHLEYYLEDETVELGVRLIMGAALFIPVSLCLKMLLERRSAPKKSLEILLYAGAVAGIFLYNFTLLKNLESVVSITRYLVVSASLYIMFTFIPYWFKRENYECYVFTLLTKFTIAFVYALTLYFGFSAMLFTVHTLFSIDVSGRLYFDLAAILFGVFAPVLFLAEVPKAEEDLSLWNYTKEFKILLLNIIIPMLIAYTFILYAYFFKILVTRQWPVGIVAHLILWYALFSTAVLFFVSPLHTEKQWVKCFSTLFPVFILLPLVMMFISLGIRINAYGITESRYIVLLAGLWITGCMLYFVLAKKVRNIILAASLVMVMLLAVCGPWSCYSVAKYSQNMRFTKILNQYGMLQDGKIVPLSGEISEKDKQEIRAIITYFDNRYELSDLKYLPQDFDYDNMKKTFGFEMYEEPVREEKDFSYSLKDDGLLLEIKEYDYFLHVPNFQVNRTYVSTRDSMQLTVSLQQNQLTVYRGGEILQTNNIEDLVRKIHERNKGQRFLPSEEMRIIAQDNQTGQIQVTYLFKQIRGVENVSTDKVEPHFAEFYVLIKLNGE